MLWVLFIRSELDPAILPVSSRLVRFPAPLVLPRRVLLVSTAPCILVTEDTLLFLPGMDIISREVLYEFLVLEG